MPPPPPPIADARIEHLLEQSAWIRALAQRLVGDPATAEDLLQRTFVAALERRPPEVERGPPLRRWLAAVLRNFARQDRRGEGRRAEHEMRAARSEALPSTLDVVERASVQRELVEAVLALDEPYRTTILLRFFDGLQPRAIAARMEVPVDTVRTRLARGIARLRERLDEGRRGDRAAWLAALAPLALGPRPFFSPFLPSTGLGASIVNAKILIAATVLAAGAALTLYLSNRGEADASQGAVSARVPEFGEHAAVAPATKSSSAPAVDEPGAAPTRSAAESPKASAPSAAVAAAPILRGRVVDDRGSPVAGVRIALQVESGSGAGATATSDAGGAFEMPYPDKGGRLVCTDAKLATVLAGVYGREPGDREPVIVVAPRVEVSGRVFAEEGFPLPGARVEVQVPQELRTRLSEILDRSTVLSWSAEADAQGAFSIEAAPRVEGSKVRASHEGYATFHGPLEENSGSGVAITLARPRSDDGMVRGQVVDGAGTPVPGARVAFGIDLTRSETDGTFAFRIEDPESFGSRFGEAPRALVAAKKGHLPARYEAPLVDGRPSWPAKVILRLGETPLAIEGRVVDHRREPVPGAIVWLTDATLLGASERGPVHLEDVLSGMEGKTWRRIDAGEDGRFRIEGLLAREYGLRAMDTKTLLIAEEGPVAAGDLDLELRLPTDQLYPRVAGRVVSHAGKPIAGAQVFPMCDAFHIRRDGRIVSTSHEALDGTTTDAEGRFELENVPMSLVYLRVEGDQILPLEYGRYVEGDAHFTNAAVKSLPKDRIEDLEIEVDVRCHLKVELGDPTTADSLSVLDGEGRELVINVFVGNGRREQERVEIVDGRSYPMAVPDSGRTLVLYKGDLEVSRTALALVPGELKEIRL